MSPVRLCTKQIWEGCNAVVVRGGCGGADRHVGGGSTTDELADMVMDVIEGGGPAVPTTTPLHAPHP